MSMAPGANVSALSPAAGPTYRTYPEVQRALSTAIGFFSVDMTLGLHSFQQEF
jgi:hypothetical protein